MQADFGEGPATPADVASAYRVLLGRDVESAAVVAAKASQPFSVLVGGLLSSGEFTDGIVRAISDGQAPGDRYAGLPSPDDRLWASTRLPLTPETVEALRVAETWRDLLARLYADARFGPQADALEGGWSRAGFLAGLDAWSPPDPAAGARETDWGESIAERTAAMKRDTAERLRFELPPQGAADAPGPLISVLTPVYQSPLEFLARAIDSVRAQTYGRWELILVDDGSPKPTVCSMLQAYAALDARIRVVLLPENAGIAAASNAGLEIARGERLALLDHDDMLTRDALEHVAAAVRARPDADLLYSDEAFIGEDDAPQDLFPKPDWSPLLMLNGHYIGHLTVHRTARVRELGGFRSLYDFSQDYDLALRVADHDPVVVHIDRILYGWRRIAGSAAAGGKDFARRTNIAALQDALDRRGWGGFAEALPAANRARRRPSPPPRVAVIVPSDDAENIAAAVRSITERTWYGAYEVFVVTNSPLAAGLRATLAHPRLRWVAYDRPFNFSDKCDAGAAAATEAGCEHLVFFNDDVRVITPDWIESLLEVATLPGVGAVGAKLLYEDGRVQHAGMVTGVRRLVGTAFHMRDADTHELSNLAVQSVREVSLLCAALMMMRADLYADLDGFDAVDFPVAHSDVDLCLRIRERGLSLVYTPHAVLRHLGHVSIGAEERADDSAGARPKDKADIRMLDRFPEALRRDPFFPEAMRGLHHRDAQARFALHPGARRTRPRTQRGRDVLLISHELTRSGAPQLVLDMARVLIAQGCDVVVASRRDGPMRERIQALGAPVIVDSRLLTEDRDVFDLGRNFDVVIANTVVSWPVVRLLGGVTDVYWYLQEVDLVGRYAKDQPRMLEALPLAREIWAPSRLAADALTPYGASARLVPYGVDDAGRRPPPDNRRVRICVLGAYERRKGQDLAVEAWRRLPPELQAAGELVFWGRELEDDHLAALHDRARGVDGIRIEGELAHAEALAALRGSDAVFIPSREESMSLVALDGLSAGRPVVCSRAVGASAWLEPDVSGLVCPTPEPQAFAPLLARVIADAGLRARLGGAGRAVFEREFTHDAFRDRLLQALPSLRPGVSATAGARS